MATVICKTPSFNFTVNPRQQVHVYGFPQAVEEGRWVATSSVTSVGAQGFHVQSLSSPGLSGGAVIATGCGQVIGYMHGAQDAVEGNGTRPLGSYAFRVANLPKRESSRRTSGDEPKVGTANSNPQAE